MALPEMCEECKKTGGYWVPGKNGGMARCTCERGLALGAQDLLRRQPPVVNVDPKISEDLAALGVSMLSAMKFFPAEEGARIVIADELRSMCASQEQVFWLAKRMCRLFTEWPGLPALRSVFWSKYVPLDRLEARNETAVFPDGVPAEVETDEEYKPLPAGSDDPELDAEIRKLANLKRLN